MRTASSPGRSHTNHAHRVTNSSPRKRRAAMDITMCSRLNRMPSRLRPRLGMEQNANTVKNAHGPAALFAGTVPQVPWRFGNDPQRIFPTRVDPNSFDNATLEMICPTGQALFGFSDVPCRTPIFRGLSSRTSRATHLPARSHHAPCVTTFIAPSAQAAPGLAGADRSDAAQGTTNIATGA